MLFFIFYKIGWNTVHKLGIQECIMYVNEHSQYEAENESLLATLVFLVCEQYFPALYQLNKKKITGDVL